jgi:integrase
MRRARGLIHANAANPARWRGHLDKLLAKQKRLKKGHHAALAYEDLRALIVELRSRTCVSARATEFLIHTAARTTEVLHAKFSEFDLSDGKAIWTVPGERMKAGQQHRVTLTARAVEIIQEMRGRTTGDWVFPGIKKGQLLNHAGMSRLIERLRPGVTIHGFRSSFRDFAGDALMKRQELMEVWAA